MYASLRITYALVVRDMMTRFGRHHLGFVWTVLEPMILTTGVMLVWSVIKEPLIHGIPVITFVLTGYMPLTLWRHLTNPMPRILRDNSALLYHRPISHVQIIVSRSILEFLSTSTALLIVYFVVTSLGFVRPTENWGLAILAWGFTAWYFGAMGLVIGAITEFWEPAEKFVPAIQYLALPISGTFFMSDWLPDSARRLLLLNPSVHCFEMFRAGVLGDGITTHYDWHYLASVSAIMSVFGIVSIVAVRERIDIR